ncbi:MAG: hypothetical protein Ta2B_19790 [Termitinemataceae bacterium]|nr:MAG: hypothetical protein Ta2B_19790 [Termitinemataceae bacterium]
MIRVHLKTRAILFCFLIASANFAFAQTNTVSFTINIQNVVVNTGKVYVSVYKSDASWKDRSNPDFLITLDSEKTTISCTLDLPSGDYAIAIYQDTNKNGKCDYGGFLGLIPQEIIGVSNYTGKGYPASSFSGAKFKINPEVKKSIDIGLYKL